MPLADRVSVSRRFQRAIRIDTDLRDPSALEGFVCPRSFSVLLENMARHISESGQGAFTWTGPYGSGKSSLALALSAMLNGDAATRDLAASLIGDDIAASIWDALPIGTEGWHILPIVGRRDRPEQVVGEALESRGFIEGRAHLLWEERQVLDELSDISARDPKSSGGLLVLVDEMGKFLEGAARDISDVYFFQQLAEIASRSGGRLIFVGILHQAFDEYSHRLSREMREEWAKIQGRFIDLPVNAGVDEQIALLGKAIESDHDSAAPSPLSERIAVLTSRATLEDLPQHLENCWPLHPIVACLLGPISRRRFGQNQRSIFGFLNSTEPRGFQDFLRSAEDGELYLPDQLWDYLRFNLEPSIMASPDGHRWALAVDALERCESMGGGELHLRLLKAIALIDMFKERSGLAANATALQSALPGNNEGVFRAALEELQLWSLIIFRKFNSSFSVFEGSDFDIDEEVGRVLTTMPDVDFARLNEFAGLQPIVAKRHYHETGALRWFDVVIAPLADVKANATDYRPRNGAVGTFLLAICTHGETENVASHIAQSVVLGVEGWDLVIGLPQRTWNFSSLAQELLAVEQVREESPQLQGDRIARREVETRVSTLRGYMASEIERALDSAYWYSKKQMGKQCNQSQRNTLASDLARDHYCLSPRLRNELLNRVKPSGTAVAARNALLRCMVQNGDEERLGIEGYPAEGGLYTSLLGTSGVHRKVDQEWRFVVPKADGNDPCNLAPAWQAAAAFLESNQDRVVPLSEVYDVWREPPFGIKEGLLPVLAASFILSRQRELAFYRQSIFQSQITDLDMEYLARDPFSVQLRWMDLSDEARALLSEMADIVRDLDPANTLSDLAPIDVAKGLVAVYDRLPHWVGRTQGLSTNAKQVRQLFKQASDPNRLIFDDIPQRLSDEQKLDTSCSLGHISNNVRSGLIELQGAYPAMLHRLREALLVELQVPNASESLLGELRARAENVRQLSGDHRLEAFIIRLSHFYGSDQDMESLVSMATNKPPPTWVDADIDHAAVALAEMAQKFNHLESYAHVKGRSDKRHAMAVTVGMNGTRATHQDVFDVTDKERQEVKSLIKRMEKTLEESGEPKRHIVLAALAELSARHLSLPTERKQSEVDEQAVS
ncbi:MAG: hypothetical protein OXJ55_12235 [Caldilineaceae bacterium]|nr:hypothetical protein [Caldilineaceae bacterium]